MSNLEQWLSRVWGPGHFIYAKRLSLNDTGGTRSHQAGFYVSKLMAFAIEPSLESSIERNPRVSYACSVNGIAKTKVVNLIYYNSERFSSGKTRGRDECRFTGWGGSHWGSSFGPDSTGAMMICAVNPHEREIHVWVANSSAEDEILDLAVGRLGPREEFVLDLSRQKTDSTESEFVSEEWSNLPDRWLQAMPTGAELAEYIMHEVKPYSGETVDSLLVRRVRAEYRLFRHLESKLFSRQTKHGFANLETFLELAKKLVNSRASRAGRSLELAVRLAFDENQVHYSWQPQIGEGSIPDFIFPSTEKYLSRRSNLGHLAVKRTLKERWRGVLQEAKWVRQKNLLTLDTNLSPSQLLEITNEGIRLVIPGQLQKELPMEVLSDGDVVTSFSTFIAERLQDQKQN